ncbi:MAG: helix-turn-helix domain-containing protein [Microthrixaceae bacterium]
MSERADKLHPAEMTLEEAAEKLGVHYMSAYRYVRTGQLQARQVGGRWAVDAAALASFREARKKRSPKKSSSATGRSARRSGTKREVKSLSDRLERGDEGGAWQILEEFALAAPSTNLPWVSFLADAMQLIGDRWQEGQTSVAEEHQASVVAMRLIGRLGAHGRRPGRRKGTIVVAAAPGDSHGLPTAMASEVLRSNGFGVIDLGADVPADQMWQVAKSTDRLLAVSYCATSDLDQSRSSELRESVKQVRELVGCPVLLGGAAITDREHCRRLGGQFWTSSVESLVEAAERLQAGGPETLQQVEG